jgi:hypothetical protein
MPTDYLEQRLSHLTIPVPDAGRMTARVLSHAGKPRRRQLPRLIAVGVATLVIASAILYFVPAADAVLADTPVAGDLLRDAGLTGAGNRVTSVGAVASSSGYRLELVGAYADSTRTVLLIHTEPGISLSGPGPELTDQFGRTYQWGYGTSNAQTGDVVLQFDALAWPDAITGARITLRWTSVQTAACAMHPSDTSGPACNVAGSWTLPATIGVDEGTVLALPAPARLGNANFRFTSVVSTPATIAFDIEVTGMSFGDLNRDVPDGSKVRPLLSIDLIAPNGSLDQGGGGDATFSEELFGSHIHISWPRGSSSAGDYRLEVVYGGLGQFERVVHVPSVPK